MKILARFFAASALALSFSANAGSLYFFGDSLTDTGNTSGFYGGAVPGPGYATGQWTDPLGTGVWANRFATLYGQPSASINSDKGGNNYAWAGARTYSADTTPITTLPGSPPVTTNYAGIEAAYQLANPGKTLDLVPGVAGLDKQISTYINKDSGKSSSSDLFVIMIGGNDVAAGLTAAVAVGNPAESANAITYGLNKIRQGISDLVKDGATHFLIANMPDVAATPKVLSQGLATPVGGFVVAWNTAFNSMILDINATTQGLDIDVLDLYGLGSQTSAFFAARGVANPVNAACLPAHPADCQSYLYSDPFHPSSAVHTLVADAAFKAVPLPGSIALLSLGLLGMLSLRRKMAW